jgi:hypothetical protein
MTGLRNVLVVGFIGSVVLLLLSAKDSLTHEKADRERRERGVESTGELIVRALNDWVASGFPGSWDDWWDRCSACSRRVTASTRHVHERSRSRG